MNLPATASPLELIIAFGAAVGILVSGMNTIGAGGDLYNVITSGKNGALKRSSLWTLVEELARGAMLLLFLVAGLALTTAPSSLNPEIKTANLIAAYCLLGVLVVLIGMSLYSMYSRRRLRDDWDHTQRELLHAARTQVYQEIADGAVTVTVAGADAGAVAGSTGPMTARMPEGDKKDGTT